MGAIHGSPIPSSYPKSRRRGGESLRRSNYRGRLRKNPAYARDQIIGAGKAVGDSKPNSEASRGTFGGFAKEGGERMRSSVKRFATSAVQASAASGSLHGAKSSSALAPGLRRARYCNITA